MIYSSFTAHHNTVTTPSFVLQLYFGPDQSQLQSSLANGTSSLLCQVTFYALLSGYFQSRQWLFNIDKDDHCIDLTSECIPWMLLKSHKRFWSGGGVEKKCTVRGTLERNLWSSQSYNEDDLLIILCGHMEAIAVLSVYIWIVYF